MEVGYAITSSVLVENKYLKAFLARTPCEQELSASCHVFLCTG